MKYKTNVPTKTWPASSHIMDSINHTVRLSWSKNNHIEIIYVVFSAYNWLGVVESVIFGKGTGLSNPFVMILRHKHKCTHNILIMVSYHLMQR